jgi:PIN domain nuclease of toxin-antitoxin system
MSIKIQLGKLKLNLPITDVIEGQRQTNSIEILSITLTHVLALESIPPHHKDPFDRLLIAQANVEDAALVSNDSAFEKYPVRLLW